MKHTHTDQLVVRLQTLYGLSAPRARELLDEFWRTCAACDDEDGGAALQPASNGEERHD